MSDGADVVMFPKMFTRPRLTIDRLAGRLGRFGITDETLENWPDIVLQIMAQHNILRGFFLGSTYQFPANLRGALMVRHHLTQNPAYGP